MKKSMKFLMVFAVFTAFAFAPVSMSETEPTPVSEVEEVYVEDDGLFCTVRDSDGNVERCFICDCAKLAQSLQPEAVQPEAVQPEIVQSETVQPETVQPEAVQPETVQSETVQPETVQPEAVQPETVRKYGVFCTVRDPKSGVVIAQCFICNCAKLVQTSQSEREDLR